MALENDSYHWTCSKKRYLKCGMQWMMRGVGDDSNEEKEEHHIVDHGRRFQMQLYIYI